MSGKLCILGCHNFQQEVAAAIAAEEWTDVVSADFPARCGQPPVTWNELRSLLPPDCTQIIVLGRVCLSTLGEPPAGFPPARIIGLAQCFHLVAGEHMVNAAIEGGAYLMTPAWLANWPAQLRQLGFAPGQANEFFRDFATELVLLDTGIDSQSDARLVELAKVVTLPIRRIAVGIDFVRLQLMRWVLEWRQHMDKNRARKTEQRHAAELADLACAVDMLARLAKPQEEAQVVGCITELFQMLFAPAALHYLRIEHGIALEANTIPQDMLTAMRELKKDHEWTPGGTGFLLRIGRSDDVLGVIAIDRVAFVQYLQRYLNMALALTGVCAMAIENARHRRKLLEMEKMASLGVLIAGVAHEISTPLGVGLTAASALQQQVHDLDQRFIAHSMTRSDLAHCLKNAESGSALLLHNLTRIGQLIDVFRNVAVNEQAPPPKRAFRLRDCFDEVIRSFGARFPADRVKLKIECDPELEMESLPADWASIFNNLVNNSIVHGFRNRAHGVIEIKMTRGAKTLQIDYRDDGVGMAAEAMARVFDPFYTTDLQHGTGLGMYLVYNLITHRMGGSIDCESQSGQGVHFHIEVPL